MSNRSTAESRSSLDQACQPAGYQGWFRVQPICDPVRRRDEAVEQVL